MDKETRLIHQIFLHDEPFMKDFSYIASAVNSIYEYLDEHRGATEIPENEFMGKLEDLKDSTDELISLCTSVESKVDEYYELLENDDDVGDD